jgi:hypothetical protein
METSRYFVMGFYAARLGLPRGVNPYKRYKKCLGAKSCLHWDAGFDYGQENVLLYIAGGAPKLEQKENENLRSHQSIE